jgi:hypothetical protein
VDAEHTRGWVVDLDGPQRAAETPADDSLADLLRLSRAGLWLAAGTLFVVLAAVVVVGVGLPGLGGEVVASAGAGATNETAVERAVVAEVNEARAARGLGELSTNGSLVVVVERHTLDMCERGFEGHENPDGDGVRERYATAGLWCPGEENIYYSPNGALADHVVRSWLNSDGHRETIVAERFDRQGLAVVFGEDGEVWVTQTFC